MADEQFTSLKAGIVKALSVLPDEEVREFVMDGYLQTREEMRTVLVAA